MVWLDARGAPSPLDELLAGDDLDISGRMRTLVIEMREELLALDKRIESAEC